MEGKISTVSENVENSDQNTGDLEQALSVIGIGWYNIKYSLVLALFLIAAIVEPIGYSYVLPAAKCDLNMSDAQRGVIASVPYIGVVATSFPWGYLVDTRGRKKIIIISALASGFFGILSGFMPELISFTIFKALGALWYLILLILACPAAVPYTFIGEILPQRYRDITLSVTNALQILGSALVPLLGWGILPLEFRTSFGAYDFRSWRLLCMIYSCIFIIAAFLLSFGPESPKYLVSQGKTEEALKVLQTMYAGNKRKSPDDFPIKKLKVPPGDDAEKPSFLMSLKIQTVPLVQRPYLKWLCLNGFLLFGIFSVYINRNGSFMLIWERMTNIECASCLSSRADQTCRIIISMVILLNGLYMWVPDVLNRVLTGSSGGLTACGVIAKGLNKTVEITACDDSIDSMTFIINSISSVSCAFIALAVSLTVKIIGKKALLIIVYFVMGIFCILINHVTQSMAFAILLSSLALSGLAIGPVNAFSVDIFPTNLRGMAVSLSMMLGRSGSIIGTNVAGLMINAACEATFYSFGGLLLLCGLASFLLPRAKQTPPTNRRMTRL